MTEILWMNLNLIELLTILQFITIRNNFDGNNIKPQAIKRLVKHKCSPLTPPQAAHWVQGTCSCPSLVLPNRSGPFLPYRPLLPFPYRSELPLPSIGWAGPPSCPICSHLHHAEPDLFRGWPFGMEWSPIGSPVTSKSILPEIPSAT